MSDFGMSDMGEYHDPGLRLEQARLGQQQLDQARVCPDVAGLDAYNPNPQSMTQFLYDIRTRFYTNIQQQIEAGEYYPREPIAQEDYMLGSLDDLYERGVINEAECVAIFGNWITRRRPDTEVIKVQPKPRGYGRGYHNE